MSKFFCNGADAECACPILCADCSSADWTGGTEIKTNADHIRSMTDEELAKWLVLRTVYSESAWSAPSYLNFKTCTDDDFDGALKGTSEWLKQPYKE